MATQTQKEKEYSKFVNNAISSDIKKCLMKVILKQELKLKFGGEVDPIYIFKRGKK